MVLGQDGNHLVNLLAILAIIFVLFKFIYVIYTMSGLDVAAYREHIFYKFILPANLSILLSQPWAIFTYMFMHDGVMHILGNLLWLWAFGFIMQDLMGNGKLIPVFIYGGLGGGILFVLAYNLFPRLSPEFATLEGASAGVMAVAIATTTLAPGYRIFPMLNGGFPIWELTLIFVIIDFAGLPVKNTGGHLAHLGGGLIGFLFIHQLRRGKDWSSWMNNFFDWVGDLFNPRKKPGKRTGQSHFYKIGGTNPYRKVPNINQQRIDSLLDKINQKGYRSLTEEEKEILKRASEDDNL